MLEFLKKVLVAVMSVFLIGEDVDLTEPPNALSPAIISDYTLPEPAVEAINPISIEVPPNSEIQAEDKDIGCSCVKFVREETGINFPIIPSAKDLEPNLVEPQNGAIVIFKDVSPYGKHGHLAVVTQVHPLSFEIIEKNLKPCDITTRLIKKSDSAIKGFYNG